MLWQVVMKKTNSNDLLYIFITLTLKRGQCSGAFRKPRWGTWKTCALIIFFQLRLATNKSQRMLRTHLKKLLFFFLTERTQEKCIINKNIKGHLVILVLCFVSLHKYCYSTAPIQGPENSCVHVPPLELSTGRSINA